MLTYLYSIIVACFFKENPINEYDSNHIIIDIRPEKRNLDINHDSPNKRAKLC